MTASQKPLPDVYNVHAWGMGDLMVALTEQIGIPLREMIDLSPQQLYDLAREFSHIDDRNGIEHLIVIDDETAEALKEHLRHTVDRLRPENRGVAHNVAIEARSIALDKAGLDPNAVISLTELEKRLWDVTGEPAVVLDDGDFATYGVEKNRIISARPHGRSDKLDGRPIEPVDKLTRRQRPVDATLKPDAPSSSRPSSSRRQTPRRCLTTLGARRRAGRTTKVTGRMSRGAHRGGSGPPDALAAAASAALKPH